VVIHKGRPQKCDKNRPLPLVCFCLHQAMPLSPLRCRRPLHQQYAVISLTADDAYTIQQTCVTPWRMCVQDEVRISHHCHQCQLPGLLLLEKEGSMLQQQTSLTFEMWVGGRSDRCLGNIQDAGQCCNTAFLPKCCVNADVRLHCNLLPPTA